MSQHNSAVIVQRVDKQTTPDTGEIERLAEAAGYTVESIITQSRSEHIEYNVGKGKVPEIYYEADTADADAIIIDNQMGPYQMYNFGVYVSNDITVFDRYTLILDIFEQRATTKEAQLQVELAQLRYEKPRAETKVRLAKRDEKPGYMGLGDYQETREADLARRMETIQTKLARLQQMNADRRETRRDGGFSLVAIAGYTNAGKSTLLRRLSADHSVEENTDQHPDLPTTAVSTDKLFTTLDTTTRRMAFDKRDVLLTDTVGFIRDLPDWLIDAFAATFDSIFRADLVVLAVDATKPVSKIRERITSCHHIFAQYDVNRITTVFNKVDQLSDEEYDRKTSALNTVAPNPISVSARENQNISTLKSRIHESLPELTTERLQLPMTDESMSIVSWIHDNAYVTDKTFTPTSILIEFEANPRVVGKARDKAQTIVPAHET